VFIRENGKIVKNFAVDFDMTEKNANPPFETTIAINPDYSFDPACDYTAEFSVTLKEDTFYAQKGYELGFFQYPLKEAACVCPPEFVQSSGIELNVDETDGNVSLTKNGIIYASGGRPCFDRPYTGMEWSWLDVYAPVRGDNIKISAHKIEKSDGFVKILYKINSKIGEQTAESYVEARYTLSKTGAVEADILFNISPALKYVPRAGVKWILPSGFEKLVYYGYGENENYSDRMLSAKLGVFESTVTAQHFPFIPPSECGGHEKTRWVKLQNEEGRALTFTGAKPFHFDARRNSVEDYQNAKHDHELCPKSETYLHIDAVHSGIGSNMGWSSDYSPEHLAAAGVYQLRFNISI
jgi:beta-galactosidase